MILKDGKKLNICFSYPYGNGFDPAFLQSIIGLLLYETSKPKEERILGSIIKKGGCYIDDNRNAIAIDFCNVSTDEWVLMVDTDVEFGHDILEKFAKHIIANPDARIIAGRVNLMNGFPVFYNVKKEGHIHQPFFFEGLKTFDLVGTGIICIHREAFKKIGQMQKHFHFFNKIITRDGYSLGDDFSFCMRAKRAKLKVYGAWDVFGKHWKVHPCAQMYPEFENLTPSYVPKQ
jgi:hypothetical protein